MPRKIPRWRASLAWIGGAVTALILLPAAVLSVGDAISAPLTAGESTAIVDDWRGARLAYRVSRLSPFFWGVAAEREDAVDRALSGVYLRQVIDGTIAEHSAHLDFLDNRSSEVGWRAPMLETMLRYGDAEGVLEAAWGNDEACVATAAALSTGSRPALVQWLPRCADAPAVLYLLADLPDQVPAGTDPLTRFIEAEGHRRAGDGPAAQALLAGLLDDPDVGPWATESFILTLPDEIPAALSQSPTDDPRFIGAWLAAAALTARSGGDPTAAIDRALTLSEALPDLVIAYRFLAAPFLPHPARFEPLLSVTDPERQARLRLLQARAALQGMDIAGAQSALKPIRDLPVSEAIHAERLMLRVLTRELSGDLEGARKYAEEGLSLDKAQFKLIKARLMLLGGERQEPQDLLDNLGHYSLTPDQEAQRIEALQLARRLNGAREGFTLAGRVADENIFQEDAVFRTWFVDYLAQTVASPSPTPSLAIPMLRYWRGANKHGDFLISIRIDDALCVQGEVVRAHLGFLRGQLTDGDGSGWSDFSAARVWGMEEPFRFLLPHAQVPYRVGVPR
ncbi:MAG: hypothetical protein ACI8RZ_000958 [Myxococcota bacterium]|jgi:hypothetical protein